VPAPGQPGINPLPSSPPRRRPPDRCGHFDRPRRQRQMHADETAKCLARGAESLQAARMNSNSPELAGAPADIRPAVDGDVVPIQGLALDNGMFAPDDMAGFDEMLRGSLDGSLDETRWIVAKDAAGRVAGAACYAPEPFADRVWNLYFLAVHPDQHRSGIGTTLVAHAEQSLRTAGEQVARVLIVETSSTDAYKAARRFYVREGFDREARIREFYGPGDDKIVFWKSLR